MDVTRCAEILWTATRRLTSALGNHEALEQARLELAKLIWALDGDGFPAPRSPLPAERQQEAWKQCAAAAQAVLDSAGKPQPPSGRRALLWDYNRDHPKLPANPQALGLNWPFDSAHPPVEAFGPLYEGGDTRRPLAIFIYGEINEAAALTQDGDVGEGLFPRHVAVAPDAVSRAAFGWATAFFGLWLIATLVTILWLYVAADFTHGALTEMRSAIASVQGLTTLDDCVDQQDADLRTACQRAWIAAWAGQQPTIDGNAGFWDRIRSWFWLPTDLRGQLSLLWPLATATLAVAFLAVAAGLATNGTFSGAFIDQRNRISLSRVQQIAWTIVLLGGGFLTLAIFNAALLAGFVRDAAQRAAAGDTTATIVGLFPSMNPALWSVLGITVALSPYISKQILRNKQAPPGDFAEVEVRRMVPFDALDSRRDPDKATWADLFTGESEANTGTIDISRLQHLVITGLLLGAYVILLIDYVRAVSWEQILRAVSTGVPVFASMPPVDGTFLGLLVLSHGAYLSFKALPAAGTKK